VQAAGDDAAARGAISDAAYAGASFCEGEEARGADRDDGTGSDAELRAGGSGGGAACAAAARNRVLAEWLALGAGDEAWARARRAHAGEARNGTVPWATQHLRRFESR